MRKLYIHVSKSAVQTALVEDGTLIELIVEKKDNPSVVGNIYAGLVQNINTQFAFIDIGLSKNAFLCVTDNKEKGLFADGKLTVKASQTIVVQAIKDASELKGAAVTTQLSFPSENMIIYATTQPEVGISKKIVEKGERIRLKKIAHEFMETLEPLGYGLIMRTKCKSNDKETLSRELREVLKRAEAVMSKKNYIKAPSCIFSNENHDIYDLLSLGIDEAITNDNGVLQELSGLCGKCELYEADADSMFSFYGLTAQIEKASQKHIWLKSGAFLIIEKTEACIVIDVNSGKIVSNKKNDELAFKINCEAAAEIAKQLRLRNLSGTIIIDFITMKEAYLNRRLVEKLAEYVRHDRLSAEVLGMTFLGIVMMTRKRTRAALI